MAEHRSGRLDLAGSVGLLAAFAAAPAAWAATYPSGFSETVAFYGLTRPTAVRFAADGRVFVAEKSGLVKVFDGPGDATATTAIDVRTAVHDFWDRGLLGLALDPSFEANGYVYLLYAYDFNPVTGQGPPYWGDGCPDPPGATTDGCPVSGRLSRFQVGPDNTLDGGEHVLLEHYWCQQYPSHSVGGLAFDSTGALIVVAGDGANFNWIDYGQGGNNAGATPKNPCGDPPAGVAGKLTPPSAEGGALRSQDLRSTGDPLGYNGSVLRVDPATGAALPTNPLYGGPAAEDDRVIAHGLRNPFRTTVRPGTDEVWIGDVGWNSWEEIDRVASTTDATVENFGWPCYEGNSKLAAYDSADLALCESLYLQGGMAHTQPYYPYFHASHVDPQGDGCKTGSSAIGGLAFYTTGAYPASYQNALFFADFARDCIYVLQAGGDGLPSLATRTAFGVDAANPVDLQRGPGGDLYYVDFDGGRIVRIRYTADNTTPRAVAQALPASGPAPLHVQFDGSASSDPDPGATLFYDWDLDGDGRYDDSALASPKWLYTRAGTVEVGLLVTDDQGATDTAAVTVTVGDTAPTATVLAPARSLRWKVGDAIPFSGQGADSEDGALPAAALRWEVALHHCPGGPGDCHVHAVQSFDGVASGVFPAPDHEWYSYLEFTLTVTDSGGLAGQASVAIDPLTVEHTYLSVPAGLPLSVGGEEAATPFVAPAIVGSTMTLGVASPRPLGRTLYCWTGWSDGGEISHDIVAAPDPASWTATFAPCQPANPCGMDDDCNGSARRRARRPARAGLEVLP